VRLDGVELDRTWLTGTELHAGGRLQIDLGPGPGRWTAQRPPSVSTGTPGPPDPGLLA
jgi:putative alpha-1,2-mannosidase